MYTLLQITEDWDEDTITWDTLENIYDKENVAGTIMIEESRLGGTLVTVRSSCRVIITFLQFSQRFSCYHNISSVFSTVFILS